jgi:immunity protein, SdpI family
MKLKWTDVLCVAAILAVVALAAALYDGLPDSMPIHWNARGAVNGYMPKTTGVAVLVALPSVFFLLFKALPALSPRGFRMGSFQHVTDIITLALTMVVAGIDAAALLAASGRNVPFLLVTQLLVGGLVIVLGNYLGKVRRNFFIGIRTPWTLASEEVWARTHRFGGRVFMIAGLALVALAWAPGAKPARFPLTLLGVTGVAAVVVFVHSYLVYRRLHGKAALGGVD